MTDRNQSNYQECSFHVLIQFDIRTDQRVCHNYNMHIISYIQICEFIILSNILDSMVCENITLDC